MAEGSPSDAGSGAGVPVLLITGPTGVGKSLIAAEVSLLLDTARPRAVQHARLDWDSLWWSTTMPRSGVVGALASAWRHDRRFRASRLVLSACLEWPEMLDGLATAIPGADPQAFFLSAPMATLAERLRQREAGSRGESVHLANVARDVAVYDHLRTRLEIVDTSGRGPTEIAIEILERSGWLRRGTGPAPETRADVGTTG